VLEYRRAPPLHKALLRKAIFPHRRSASSCVATYMLVRQLWAVTKCYRSRRAGRIARFPPDWRGDDVSRILNSMVQYTNSHLDASFAALADATRRGVLEQLGRSEASITDLADKFHMTLTGMKKHVGILEDAGLVTTQKIGRVRTCKLGERGLEDAAAWIERHRELWAARFDELDRVVEELKRKERGDRRKKTK